MRAALIPHRFLKQTLMGRSRTGLGIFGLCDMFVTISHSSVEGKVWEEVLG